VRYVGLVFRIAISAALLYWILSNVDLGRLGNLILDTQPFLLAVSLLLYFFGVIIIGAIRWRLLLVSQGVSTPFAYLVQSYMVATFFNNVLPTNIGGDVFRIKDAARYTESKTLSSAIIFVDRLIGFAGLFVLALGAVVFGGEIVRSLPGLNWLWAGLVGITVVVMVVLVTPEVVAWSLQPLLWLESQWVTKRVGVVTSALFQFRRRVPALFEALVISLLFQGSIVFFYFLIAQAMQIPLPLDYCFLIIPLVLVVQLFPSINGFGVRESAFVFFFRTIGLSPEQAVSLSFVSTGVIIAMSLLGGVIYATRDRTGDAN
jgi:uncharacterized membrane protein YbhN (UPF0104 family)